MSIDDARDETIRHPIWISRPHLLTTSTSAMIAVAGVGQVLMMSLHGFALGGVLGLLLVAAGHLIARRRAVLGVVVVAIAPVVAATGGSDPIVLWTMTVFSGFLFAYQGVVPLLAGALFSICNFGAVVVSLEFRMLDLAAVVAAVSAVAAVALGASLDARRRYWSALADRAREAIAAREVEADRRVAEERLSIARDLHDVVGHEVAVLSVQLSGVEVALATDPALAQSRIEEMRAAVQSILRETKEILDVLRAGDVDDLRPSPELARTRELVASYLSIGLQVEAQIGELPSPLEPSVSAAGYRIIQEALTNAHRHGAGDAQLTVSHDDGHVLIAVVNRRDPRHRGEGSGYGLIGVRERADSVGGTVDVAVTDSQFRLTARLPVPERTAS